jgi:hypothetical protein
LLVSRADTCRKAIEYHLPLLERCWLICSARSYPVADELQREFQQVQFPDPIIITDINNPLEYSDAVNDIYQHLPDGWREDDVMADYTGMTAHGSVGMALACLAPVRPLEYMQARYDDELRPIETLNHPIEIFLQPTRVERVRHTLPGAGE